MKEQFVTLEIALKLKELGFNEECLGHFVYNSGEIHTLHSGTSGSNKQTDSITLAPLWQQVIDWLDSKNIFIATIYLKSGKFFVSINNECDLPITDDLVFEEYENRNQAIQQAILKALEIITNK